MEDILSMIESMSGVDNYNNNMHQRSLVSGGNAVMVAPWKIALWERNSVEPAMLRVPIVILTFCALWGINLYVMEKLRMQFHSAIAVKSAPIGFVITTSITLFFLYAVIMNVVSSWGGYGVEIGISVFYFTVLILAFIPSVPGQENRAHALRLLRTVFFPGSTISFPEVLLADALTSVSKVLKDIGVTVVAIYAFFSNQTLVSLHNEAMILVALLASLPFWIRIRQCWVQFDNAADGVARIPIALNILKYASAFPPIWLAAAASLGYFHPQLPALTAVFAAVNSVFSFGWDLIMDWGIISFNRSGGPQCRKRFYYAYITYPVITVVNACLRFSWAANRVAYFASMQPSHLVLLVQIAEVIRRSLWNFYRIEWEMIVQHERLAGSRVTDDDEDDEKLGKSVTRGGSSAGLLDL